MNKWLRRIILLINLMLISLRPLNSKPQIQKEQIIQKINDDSVLKYLEIYNVKYPKIALAQAKLESNSYRSKLYLKQHNLFGFVASNKRTTTSHRLKHKKYAYYLDYVESIHDYALYQNTFIDNISSEKEYLKYLGKHYAADKHYVIKIRKILNNL